MMGEFQLYHQLWISAAMMAATTFVHGVFVASAAAVFRTATRRAHGIFRFFRDSFSIVVLVLWLMVAHVIEIAMWAGVFIHFDVFMDWATALYFSASSYTTLGFGDVLAPAEWRLLAGAAAANGFLLFGVSAAFLFDAARRLNLADTQSD